MDSESTNNFINVIREIHEDYRNVNITLATDNIESVASVTCAGRSKDTKAKYTATLVFTFEELELAMTDYELKTRVIKMLEGFEP